MSSEGEGSTTSTFKQFGLYRTIDARTEEFMRLSRKRQLRQGCICAAISTAVTVIIVISIILVYEYNIVYNAKTLLKPTWLSLLNDSIDALPFDAKLNKAKLNLDHTTLQLLPILLKTFKRNKYYDNVIEDDSSPNPINDEQDINMKSVTRNWLKIPSTRLYAIEYKTSPIIYLKNPTTKIEYFTKIRKIRDYQRIMNYVDKMISEKVPLGATQPMLKTDYSTYEKPFIKSVTTPMSSLSKSKISDDYKQTKNTVTKINTTDKNTTICSCSKKLGVFLKKLLSSIQKLLPGLIKNDSEDTNPSFTKHQDVFTETFTTTRTLKNEISNKIKSSIYKSPNKIQSISQKTNKPFLGKYYYTSSVNDLTLDTMIKLLKPKLKSHYSKYTKVENSASIQDDIETYNIKDSHIYSTLATPQMKKKSTIKKTDIKNSIIEGINKTENLNKILLTYDNDDYENYLDSSTHKTSSVEKSGYIHKYNDSTLKGGQPIVLQNYYNDTNFKGERMFKDHYLKNHKNISTSTNKEHKNTVSNTFMKNISNLTSNEIQLTPSLSKSKLTSYVSPSEDTTFEEDSEKSSENDETIETLETLLENFKHNSTPKMQATKIKDSSELYQWELIKIDEHAKNISNVLSSQHRANYLEIQRGDWKHEENNEEYDTNINNYLFD